MQIEDGLIVTVPMDEYRPPEISQGGQERSVVFGEAPEVAVDNQFDEDIDQKGPSQSWGGYERENR